MRYKIRIDVKTVRNSLVVFHFSKHAITASRQPPEEIAGSRRHFASKPWMPQPKQACYQSQYFKGCHIKNHSCNEAENYVEARSSWVSPAEQGLKSLSLCCHVSHHSLNPSSHTSKPVISHHHYILRLRRRESVKLFI